MLPTKSQVRARERSRDDAVRIRAQRELVVPRDLEIGEADAEADQAQRNDQESRERAAAERGRFLARVLERFQEAVHDCATNR